jgi:hypothetical protein
MSDNQSTSVISPVNTALVATVRAKRDVELTSTIRQINALSRLPEGWNGYAVAQPNPIAIEEAVLWLPLMHLEAQQVSPQWLSPHVSASEEGDVVLEWQCGPRSLTVYISPDGADVIQDSGMGGPDAMGDGEANTPAERKALWRWLLNVEPASSHE